MRHDAPNSRFGDLRNFLFAASTLYAARNAPLDPQASLTETLDLSLADWMTRGGDARIVLDPRTGLNRYFSAPFPRDVLALASSTANDASAEAFAHLAGRFPAGAGHLQDGAAYAAFLDELRAEIRDAYGLDGATDVFFAPSGTDLEYVALLAVAGRRAGGIVNALLGADEVGSGCIHSAAGQYFADETACGVATIPRRPIAGLPSIELADLPVRREDGAAHDSASLAAAMAVAIEDARARDRFALIHIVHGSKTGLVLPHLDEVDALRSRFGADVAFVVDACQARITADAVRDYLARGVIVFLTGSKFMGGPPFSGFALLPEGLAARAAPIAPGMADVFRRAEIPAAWPGRETCREDGNAGLALRLCASLFELRRFQRLGIARVSRVVGAFTEATDRLAGRLGARKVASAPAEDIGETARHPIEMQTLVTLDLSAAGGPGAPTLDFDAATAIHRALVGQGIRLGQPVRCVRLANGEWGATLRIGLSMPQVSRLDAASDADMRQWFADAMDRIGSAIQGQLNALSIP